MRTLALETSLQSGSIALLDAEQLVWQSELPTGKRTAQTLIPSLAQALDRVGWSSRDVGLVAVTSGPGSFTGLRIGVTTAKVFAYAARSDILDLNTLEVLAAQCPPDRPPFSAAAELWAVMDAQRGELFAARFTADDNRGWKMVDPTRVVPREAWLAQLQTRAAVTGPGLRGIENRFAPPAAPECFAADPRSTPGVLTTQDAPAEPGFPAETAVPSPAAPISTVCVASPEFWSPCAETVGRLAIRRYEAGQRGDIWGLVPQYFRPSAAEEKFASPRP